MTDLHDARYCEIIVLKGVPPTAKADGLEHDRQEPLPRGVVEEPRRGALAKELGATLVVLNGPRHFLMDSASGRRRPACGPSTASS